MGATYGFQEDHRTHQLPAHRKSFGYEVRRHFTFDDENISKLSDIVFDLIWSDNIGKSMKNNIYDRIRYAKSNYLEANQIWNECHDTILDFVMFYADSMLDYKYPFELDYIINLWNAGLVPSFDGTTWRLHSGSDADIVYEREI
jgi:hypothetical protein